VRALVIVVVLFVVAVPSAGAWTWPVTGPVLSGFSFDPAHPYAAGEHRGIDIGSPSGTVVLAPAGGEVTFAGSVPSSGQSVSILTADGLSVTLTHLGSLAVAKGASVAEGDRIGAVGPSGTPEQGGPYVHLGIRTATSEQGYLDPLSFLPAAAPAPSAPPAAAAAAVAGPAAAGPAVAPAAAATPAAAAAAVPTPAVPARAAAPTGEAAAAPAPAAVLPSASEPTLVVAAPRHGGHVAAPVAAAAARPAVAAPRRFAFRLVAPAAAAGGPHVARHGRAAPRRGHRPAEPVVPHARVPRPHVDVPVAAAGQHPRTGSRFALAGGAAAAVALLLALVRMIFGPSARSEGACTVREDPGSTGVAVWQRPAPHRPRGGLRRARGRVRALPPAQGRRRLDGERDGRARHAGDGGRRPERRVAA
jgi:Peptidase family M23